MTSVMNKSALWLTAETVCTDGHEFLFVSCMLIIAYKYNLNKIYIQHTGSIYILHGGITLCKLKKT